MKLLSAVPDTAMVEELEKLDPEELALDACPGPLSMTVFSSVIYSFIGVPDESTPLARRDRI